MNSELKVIIFEQKKILQNLLKLLDEQYNLVLNKDVIALGKIAEYIEEEGKKLATIEIKRRNIASEEEFNNFIKNNFLRVNKCSFTLCLIISQSEIFVNSFVNINI